YHLALVMRKRAIVVIQGFAPFVEERFGLIDYFYASAPCVPCGKKRCPLGTEECYESVNTKALAERAMGFFLSGNKLFSYGQNYRERSSAPQPEEHRR
ncbi:MAG: hypothetical protein GXO04_04595, partial [Aquificae bacterium]|nr:hypothetical protein [Aquificota bacterium]